MQIGRQAGLGGRQTCRAPSEWFQEAVMVQQSAVALQCHCTG
jgi:hypothetical protein